MSPIRQTRLSVQTKVLIPVIACLVLLPLVTVVIVDQHISGQNRGQAVEDLSTADGVFQQLLDNGANGLLARFQITLNEHGYRDIVNRVATSRSPTAVDTIRGFLGERLDDLNDDTVALVFTYDEATPSVGACRGVPFDPMEFSRATAGLTRAALRGAPGAGCISLNGAALYVASLPATTLEGRTVGALTVARRIGVPTVQEMKKLTGTEILIFAGTQIAASTLPLGPTQQVQTELASGGDRDRPGQAFEAVVGHEHYLFLPGTYEPTTGAAEGFRYALLSSYESMLMALDDTRRTLVAVSLAGILVSAAAVWFFIRRFIHPLRELRDSAEAVGRGDFSRRVERLANDECGDLADAFNRMTANLQTSRAELEKAVEILKATQHQLIQSEKLSAVGQFVAGVAHELNNPLTAVIGFSDLLATTSSDPEIRPHLDRIAKSAQRCHKIVQNLLSFARQHPPERDLVGINTALDEVMEIMAYDLRTSNITVAREFQQDLPMVLGDRHQLQQVFINIVSNARQAIQALRPDGRITIRTRSAGGRVRIDFMDNGPGIRPEHLRRVFDPFFTTKPVGKGTGLGLSLSYGIIQEHGGTISAESVFGSGATFVIDLPAAPSASAPDAAAPEEGVNAPGGQGRAVLVVDDEQPVLDLASELLRRDGYEVETVPSAEQAVAALGRRKFDVIACDWKMPGMNGMQFYEHLVATAPAVASRVVFMTGDVVNDSFQEFLRRNGRSCITKPFSIKEFRNSVAAVFSPVC